MASREVITSTKLRQFLSGPAPVLRGPDGLGVRRFKGTGKASFIAEAKVRGMGKARRITIGPAEPKLLTRAKDEARLLVARLRSGEDVSATLQLAHRESIAQRISINIALNRMLDPHA